MQKQLIGEFLLNKGYISRDQLDEAIRLQKQTGKRIGRTLLSMGVIDDDTMSGALAENLGYEIVDPRECFIDPYLLDSISKDTAVKHLVLPLEMKGPKVARVAMNDPFDLEAHKDLEFALGCAIEPVLSNERHLREAISEHYGLGPKLEAMLKSVHHADVSMSDAVLNVDVTDIENRLKKGGTKPYVDLFNFLLANASDSRASDIHFEPERNRLRVRYRIDGVLKETMSLPRWVEAGLMSRIKAVAKMDVSNRLDPQDGKVKVSVGDREIDSRVSIVPSQHGERCVIRLLDPTILSVELPDLGMSASQLQLYYRMISQPQGMILVTGPTGSGKSTSLYASINRLKGEQSNIVTVEDPIEYSVPGVTQMQVNERRGMTFTRTIRWLLRQDPDVIVIGEIRDTETASAAFQAALTGHLVLSTVHTNDSVSAVTRVRDLGVPPYLSGANLLGVVAQRLVRRLCTNCRIPGAPPVEQWRSLEMAPGHLKDPHLPGPGCRACGYSGYRGRIGIFEMLSIDDDIRDLIQTGANETILRRQAWQNGLVSLMDDCICKVSQGVTSLEEISRHIGTYSTSLRRSSWNVDNHTRHHFPGVVATMDSGGDSKSEKVAPGDASRRSPSYADATSHSRGATPEQKRSDEPNRPEATVLVVDDSPEVLNMVEYSLESAGYRVLTATNGERALETIEQHLLDDPVQLVVLDVMMPDISGFEVASKLRENIATAFLPVLMLSARGEQEHVKKGLRAGADDYLPKPFDPEELELRIRSLLRRAYAFHPTPREDS